MISPTATRSCGFCRSLSPGLHQTTPQPCSTLTPQLPSLGKKTNHFTGFACIPQAPFLSCRGSQQWRLPEEQTQVSAPQALALSSGRSAHRLTRRTFRAPKTPRAESPEYNTRLKYPVPPSHLRQGTWMISFHFKGTLARCHVSGGLSVGLKGFAILIPANPATHATRVPPARAGLRQTQVPPRACSHLATTHLGPKPFTS